MLDNVVSYLDERIEPGNPMRVFQRQMQRLNMEPLKRIHEDDERDGYIRLRKVSCVIWKRTQHEPNL